MKHKFHLILGCFAIIVMQVKSLKRERISISKESIDIVDANTIKVGKKSIKLWGIDAPEQNQICVVKSGQKKGEKWGCGIEAANQLKKLMAICSVTVGISCNAEIVGEDNQKRKLAKLMIGQVDVNQMLVKNGWALSNEDSAKQYKMDEQMARLGEQGIFNSEFEHPSANKKKKESDL